MAGTLRRTMVYLGLADGDDYDSEPAVSHDEEPVADRPRETRPMAEDRPSESGQAVARQAPVEEYRAPVTPIKRAPSSREDVSVLRQITTVHPRSYNDAKIIGESFRDGIPVIMNVTDMGEADAKRLVDFSAGLVFGLHGTIERVTNKVFLLSPSYVEILGDEKTAEPKSSFFNQS